MLFQSIVISYDLARKLSLLIFVLLIILNPWPGDAANSSVMQVTWPTSGTKAILLDELEICWRHHPDDYLNDEFKIDLLKGNTVLYKIPDNSSKGPYRKAVWEIPVSMSPGKYAIRVTTLDDKHTATSDVFEIVYEGIEIIHPTKGKTWVPGSTYAIRWLTHIPWSKQINMQNTKAFLQLVQNNKVQDQIVEIDDFRQEFIPKAYNWKVPLGQTSGQYRFKLVCDDGQYEAESEPINIGPAVPNPQSAFWVFAPQKDRKCWKEETHIIGWRLGVGEVSDPNERAQMDETLNVDLVNNKGIKVKAIAKGIPNKIKNWGHNMYQDMDWVAPADVPDGTYQIKVSTMDEAYHGISSPFKIWDKDSHTITKPNPTVNIPKLGAKRVSIKKPHPPVKVKVLSVKVNPVTLDKPPMLFFLDIKVLIEASEEFKFGNTNDPKLGSYHVWPKITVDDYEMYLYYPQYHKDFFIDDPDFIYPTGIIKGTGAPFTKEVQFRVYIKSTNLVGVHMYGGYWLYGGGDWDYKECERTIMPVIAVNVALSSKAGYSHETVYIKLAGPVVDEYVGEACY